MLSLVDVECLDPAEGYRGYRQRHGRSHPETDLFARLPTVELTGMYLEPDGNLPNHGPDPLQPENRAELQQRVVAEGADIGFTFDGDGDRCFAD